MSSPADQDRAPGGLPRHAVVIPEITYPPELPVSARPQWSEDDATRGRVGRLRSTVAEGAGSEAVDELCAEGPGDILPLYARLSSAEQRRVFSAQPGGNLLGPPNVWRS